MSNPFVTVYAEATPNPEALKFVANRRFLEKGTLEYNSIEEAENAPLAAALLQFPQISKVFLSQEFVTLTKTGETKWVELIPEVRKFIKAWLEEEKEIIGEGEFQRAQTPTESSEIGSPEEKIQMILAMQVQPAVEMDGGAIEYVDFKDGVVKLRLKGSCSGCPSSTLTLKSGIENLLKRAVPEVREVIAEEA